jgi:hypothetical protein
MAGRMGLATPHERRRRENIETAPHTIFGLYSKK